MTITVSACARCRDIDQRFNTQIELAKLNWRRHLRREQETKRRQEAYARQHEAYARALAASAEAPKWKRVLGLNGNATLELARTNYRRLALKAHPDKGGSNEAMAELNTAWQQAQRALTP